MKWATLSLLLLLSAQDDPRSLIEELRSDSAERRAIATRKLRERGASTLEALDRAATDADPEVAARCRRLALEIRLVPRLTPSLLKTIPDLLDRLASGGDRAWTSIFIEEMKRERGRLEDEDWAALAPPALKGARDDDERQWIATGIGRAHVVVCVPELLAFTRSNVEKTVTYAIDALVEAARLDIPGVRARLAELVARGGKEVPIWAMNALASAGAMEQADLVARVGLADPELEFCALRTLGRMGARGHADRIAPFVEKGKFPAAAIEALGALAAREHADVVARVLKNPEPRMREAAVQALGRMGADRAAPDIAKLIAPEGGGLTEPAIDALVLLDAREFAPRIVQSLGEFNSAAAVVALGDPTLHLDGVITIAGHSNWIRRRSAVEVLGAWAGNKELPLLNRLLDDPSESVQYTALETLALRGTPEVTRALLERIEKETIPYLHALMIIAGRLPTEELRDRALKRIVAAESGPDPNQALHASLCLLRMGRKDLRGQLALLQAIRWPGDMVGIGHAPNLFESLALLHEPETMAKLRASRDQKEPIDSRASLVAFVGEAGLALKLDPAVPVWGRLGGAASQTAAEALRRMVGREGLIQVVDGRTVRYLPFYLARRFWLERLEARVR